MLRLALYICAASTAVTAWVFYKDQQKAYRMRRIPVTKAAAMLQEAWSDNHTRA